MIDGRRVEFADGSGQPVGQPCIDLDRDHLRSAAGPTSGAQARTHFHNKVVSRHVRHPHDPLDGIRIDDEVLTPLLGGANIEFGDAAKIGGTQESALVRTRNSFSRFTHSSQ